MSHYRQISDPEHEIWHPTRPVAPPNFRTPQEQINARLIAAYRRTHPVTWAFRACIAMTIAAGLIYWSL